MTGEQFKKAAKINNELETLNANIEAFDTDQPIDVLFKVHFCGSTYNILSLDVTPDSTQPNSFNAVNQQINLLKSKFIKDYFAILDNAKTKLENEFKNI